MTVLLGKSGIARHRDELCALLADAVDSDASIGFLPPLTDQEASGYWDNTADAVERGDRLLLVEFAGDQLIGTVQLDLPGKANARHRAEVQKLLVHRTARQQGAGTRLMSAVEEEARRIGRTLLVLDTRKGDPSERLYRKLGYTAAGEIPGFALSSNGELHATILFYKLLATVE